MDNSEDRELVQVLEDDLHANLEKPGGYRICNGCGKIKNLSPDDYPRDRKMSLGFSRQCKDCKRGKQRKWYVAKHPDAKPQRTKQNKKKAEEERPQRRFPLRNFDDSAHEQKLSREQKEQHKIHSTDTESCRLFTEITK